MSATQPPPGSSGPWLPLSSPATPAAPPAARAPAAPYAAPPGPDQAAAGPDLVRPGLAPAPGETMTSVTAYAPSPFATSATASVPVPQWNRTGSRFGAGATSFGLTGRIVITVVMALVGIWLAITNILGLGVFLLVSAWVLRDLWRPTHRPRPLPPAAPPTASGTLHRWDTGPTPPASR